jgi:hypothetical protein
VAARRQEYGQIMSNQAIMRRQRSVLMGIVAAGTLACASAFAGAAGPLPPTPVSGATPQEMSLPVQNDSFPVYDAKGRVNTADWRVSTAGGNCCETYVSATPSGRLVESGGTYPWYTNDEGQHWYQVKFDVPDQNDNGKTVAGGEGATVIGPAGDIYGVTWDAYSGDHLQAYRFTAQTNTWHVADVVMKSPFYDRPWLTYAQGPFTLDNAKTRQILDVTGGGITKDIDTLSSDGLNYGDPSYFSHDEAQAPSVKIRIPVVANPDADWWQPHPGTGTMPLTAGGLLRFANADDVTGANPCAVARLNPASSTWQCVGLKGTLTPGVIRQDSRGYLTDVYSVDNGTALALATSRDGGLHWRSTTLRVPGATRHLETSSMYDVVANGALRQAVVSARFDDAKGNGQDVVFRVDTKNAQPRRLQTYLVGKGDINTANDVTGSAGYRFDYESVTLLPDGHIAVTFDDSTCLQPSTRDPSHRSPEVAILTG